MLSTDSVRTEGEPDTGFHRPVTGHVRHVAVLFVWIWTSPHRTVRGRRTGLSSLLAIAFRFLCFAADVFLLFSPRDLPAHVADRRKTLQHDRQLVALYNLYLKMWVALQKWGPITCQIRREFGQFRQRMHCVD